jgi:hypothetical protein
MNSVSATRTMLSFFKACDSTASPFTKVGFERLMFLTEKPPSLR